MLDGEEGRRVVHDKLTNHETIDNVDTGSIEEEQVQERETI